MKRVYLYFALLCISSASLVGQTTVTNASFPRVGDTLRTVTDLTFTGFDPSMVGADLSWDFTSLAAGPGVEVVYLDVDNAPAKDSFPEADMYISGEGLGQDIYYRTSNNRIVEVGRDGFDPILGAVEISVAVEGNSVLRRAPVSFGDTYDDDYGFALEIDISTLPDSLQAIFENPILMADAIRVFVDIEVEEEVDAWGTLTLPSRSHDVLRIKRTTTTNSTLEALTVAGWIDLGAFAAFLPDLVGDLLQETVVDSYVFIADDSKELVASVTIDSVTNVTSTVYRVDNLSVNTADVPALKGDVTAFPNPSFGNLNFSFAGLPTDNYRVEIYNILGAKSWSGNSKGKQLLEADVQDLRPGIYLYRVYNSKGTKITTKRLMVVRP